MEPRTKRRLLTTVALLVVALAVLAALPCGGWIHGVHETCPLCFLHVAEAPPVVVVPGLFGPATVLAFAAAALFEGIERPARWTRGPPARG
ncbi:MAG TPA: hypothetical protein ENJ09_15225 [Planctomycetes bacterium]|nr:hypothetical protein [Planctomycetota bacterium]